MNVSTGVIDKPILAHTLQSLGFVGKGGRPVRLTGATRLQDCKCDLGFEFVSQAADGTLECRACTVGFLRAR